MNIVCSGLAILLGLGILLSAAVGDDLGFGLAEEHLAPDSGKQYGAAAGDVLGDAGRTLTDTLSSDVAAGEKGHDRRLVVQEDRGPERGDVKSVASHSVQTSNHFPVTPHGGNSGNHASMGTVPRYEESDSEHEGLANSGPVPTGGLRGGGIVTDGNPLADTLASLPTSIKSEDDISRLSKGLDDVRAVIAQSFEDFESMHDHHAFGLFSSLLSDLPQMRAMLYQMNSIIPTISEALSELNGVIMVERNEREKRIASQGRRLENDGGEHVRASRREYPERRSRGTAHAKSKAERRSSDAYQTFGASNQELRQLIPHSLKFLWHMFGSELLEDIDIKGKGRGRRRLTSDDVDSFCTAPCDDLSCSCGRLRTCALNLTMSEYAVLFSYGSTTEDGEIKTDNLFDASNLYQKVNDNEEGIIALARGLDVNDQDECDALLRQFHVPCQDWMSGCTGANEQSYQLSIDEICDAIGSSEDLKFSGISKAFDPKLDDDDVCGELFSQDYYLQMRSALAKDMKAELEKIDPFYDSLGNDMDNILADGRLDGCLLDPTKCDIRTVVIPVPPWIYPIFVGTCDVPPCGTGDSTSASYCCDDCCKPMWPLPGIDGRTIPFVDWVEQRIDATVQNYVDTWNNCAEGTQCDHNSRASHAACDEFLTCTGEIWRAGNAISYTPNKYPFGPNVYNGLSTWADVWWPEAWNWDQDHTHGVALPSLLRNAASISGDDDGTFAYAHDGTHAVNLSFVFQDNHGKDLKISDGFDIKFFFEKEYTVRMPSACAASRIPGTDNTKCDDAKALLFGEEASVGHICSVAKAVKEDANQMPGKCCLDNSITSRKFGEKFKCEEGWNSCQNPGPFMSGFSPEACDNVGGTWCRAPCNKLMSCINDLRGTQNYCRASAFSMIQAENITTRGDLDDCDTYLAIECASDDGVPCDDIVVNRSSTPLGTGTNTSTSNHSEVRDNTSFVYAPNEGPNLQDLEVRTIPECVSTKLNYTFSITNVGGNCKEILKFSMLRDGTQSDLTHVLVETGFGSDLIVCPSDDAPTFRFSETVRICAGRPLKTAFVIETENKEFDSAFSEFTAGIVITEPDDEEQCQNAREMLMFDPEHINDQEICDHLADMKCGLRPISFRLSGEYEELADIPEFEEFDFEGFASPEDLSFQHVERTEIGKVQLPYEKKLIKGLAGALAVARGGARFWYEFAMKVQSFECPITVVAGAGDMTFCVGLKIGKLLKLWNLNTAGAVLAFVAKIAYNKVAAGDVEAHEAASYAKAVHRNLRKLNTAMTGNLNIVNMNMRNQHREVRRTLAEQHSIVANLLTEQHNSVGEQLTTQHVVLNDNLGSLQNNLQLKHEEIMELIESKADEVQEACTLEGLIIREVLSLAIVNSTLILKEKIAKSAAVLEEYMRDEIQAVTDSIQLTVKEIQSTADKTADNLSSAMGLQVDAKCVQPPRIKSGSGSNKAIVMAFMVYTKSHGIPTNCTIDFVDVVFHDKNGEVKSQVASLLATTPLPEGSWRQHISISIDTDKNSIRNMNDILIIDIFVKSSSGMLSSQASVLPCFPS